MSGMLFLLTHINPEHLASVQEVIRDDLATYEDKPIPYWEVISDATWAQCSASRSLRALADEIIRVILARYEESDLGRPIHILAGEETPTDVILALVEALEDSDAQLPAVRIQQVDPQTLQVTCGDRKDLPLRVRSIYWDEVILLLDMWTSRESQEEGNPPDCPRGKRLRVVYRQAEEKPRGYFSASYEGPDGVTVGLVLPWSMVMALADWEADPPPVEQEGNWTVIAHQKIFSPYGWCWYADIDERIDPSTEHGPWVPPFFQNYIVDAKLRQFRSLYGGKIVPFEREKSQMLLLEMKAQGLSTARVPATCELGRRYSEDLARSLLAKQGVTEHGSEKEEGTDE